MNAAQAYAEVERITRRRARNFAYGIMILPRAKRQAIAAIYAFAREVDDNKSPVNCIVSPCLCTTVLSRSCRPSPQALRAPARSGV